MTEEVDTVTISILGRDYQISCPPAEEEGLRKSAKYLDKQMEGVKSRGSTLAFEKVAIMAALNICHELLQKSQQASDSENTSLDKVKTLQEKIEVALQASRQIEI
ncbi:cell division protein ZapA [Gammaproteobacteria bacterium]|jgi:cell division protein ZapA|nr:cell division protein ZapA [Gammaproteobacteria bacterium]